MRLMNLKGFGSPVNLPLTCNAPLNFGSVPIGNTSTMNITCTANIPITSLNGFLPGKAIFKVSNSSLPTGPLTQGHSFSFPVTFNLAGYTLNAGSTSAPAVSPGVQTTSISVLTTNGQTGFATEQPLTLTGISVSQAPYLTMSPLQVTFASIVINSTTAEAGSDSTFVVNNVGLQPLKITGLAWTTNELFPDNPSDGPPNFNNVTITDNGDGTTTTTFDDDGYFTSSNMPVVGQTIAPGSSITINVHFNSDVIGDYFTVLQIWSNGGSAYTIFSGSADTSPIALLEVSTGEGGWLTIPHCSVAGQECDYNIDFGPQLGLSSSSKTIRFTNNGGSALIITKSKPLEGAILGADNPDTDLSEGSAIAPGDSASAAVHFQPGSSTLNDDETDYSETWTLNTNDLTFGVHILNFTGQLISKQVGPKQADGDSLFKYLGCYQDAINGRLEPQAYNFDDNTNGECQQAATSLGAVFAGTEYMTECYVGSNLPDISLKAPDTACSYNCAGDATQVCGGIGGYLSLYYDSTKYFPANGTLIVPKGPSASNTVGNYTYSGCCKCFSHHRVGR